MDDKQTEIQRLWNEALREYANETRRQLPAETVSAVGNISSVDDIAELVEVSGFKFSRFRSERERLWSVLASFVAPISTIARIGVTPSSTADFGTASSAVLGAVVHLVKSCEGVSDAYDWIEQVFQELQDFSERLGQYTSSIVDAALRHKIIAILATMLKVIGRSEHLIQKRRFRQYLRVAFLGKDQVTKQLIDDLNKLLSREQRYIQGAIYASTQRTEESVRTISDKFTEFARKTEDNQSRDHGEKQMRETLCDASAWDDVEETFIRNKRALLKGTGTWLQEEPLYQRWMNHDTHLLWLFGGPGVGKSFLSTSIVKHLLGQPAPKNDMPIDSVAYFFVKENNANLQNANIIVKTLAWQIANSDPDFRRHAIDLCRKRSRTFTAEDSWQNLFLGYYLASEHKATRRASIVLDGLDEATTETRRTVFRLIKRLSLLQRSSSSSSIRVAIVGRKSLQGDVYFERLEKVSFIEVSRHKNRDDINTYIKKRLEEVQVLRELRRKRPNGAKRANREGSKILKKVSETANGVFLWAKLLLDSLADKDLKRIEAILENPSSSLDEMISSIFRRIAGDDAIDQDVIRRILLFVTHSWRPLLFGELNIVASLPEQKPNYLLWKHMRGSLSSVFGLKFPHNRDPDALQDPDHDAKHTSKPPPSTYGTDEDRDSSDFSFEDTVEEDFEADWDSNGDGSSITETTDNSYTDDNTNTVAVSRSKLLDNLVFHLTEDQSRTQVTFYHARIREYIVQEGSPSSRRFQSLDMIPTSDHSESHGNITIMCLEMLRLEMWSTVEFHYLCDYPLCHFPYHLQSTNKDGIPREMAAKIVKGLYWLFGTESGTLALLRSVRFRRLGQSSTKHEFRMSWMYTDTHLALIQSWLALGESLIRHGFSVADDDGGVAWIGSASCSLSELLRPLSIAASKLWLAMSDLTAINFGERCDFYAYLLYTWLGLYVDNTYDAGPEESESLPEGTGNLPAKITVRRLQHIAGWAALEQNAQWHISLGCMLRREKYYNEASEHYQKAIELDPVSRPALRGLADSASEGSRSREAINWLEKAVQATPQGEDSHLIVAYLWSFISHWAESVKDYERADSAALKAFEIKPLTMAAAEQYLIILYKRGKEEELISTLRDLESIQDPQDEEVNMLVKLFASKGFWVWRLLGACGVLGVVCARAGRPQFVLDALDKALTRLDTASNLATTALMVDKIGDFKSTFYGLHDAAAELWETALERLRLLEAKTKADFERWDTERATIRAKLARHYFDRAIRSQDNFPPASQQGTAAIHRLEQLAVETSRALGTYHRTGIRRVRADYPMILWGRWLREYLKSDGRLWRPCFRLVMTETIKGVTENKEQGYVSKGLLGLAMSLFHAGDRESGAILLYSHPSKAERSIDPPIDVYLCENCSRKAQDVSEFYFCVTCLGSRGRTGPVSWCGECLDILKDPERRTTMIRYQCNPEHDFYRARPISDEFRTVILDSNIPSYEVLLDQLRGEWGEPVATSGDV